MVNAVLQFIFSQAIEFSWLGTAPVAVVLVECPNRCDPDSPDSAVRSAESQDSGRCHAVHHQLLSCAAVLLEQSYTTSYRSWRDCTDLLPRCRRRTWHSINTGRGGICGTGPAGHDSRQGVRERACRSESGERRCGAHSAGAGAGFLPLPPPLCPRKAPCPAGWDHTPCSWPALTASLSSATWTGNQPS